MKHTKVPWIADENLVYALEDCIFNGRPTQRNRFFASVQRGPETPREEAEANAAFIAKACNSHDEILEALKYAKRFLKDDDVDMDFINAAIASAEGL